MGKGVPSEEAAAAAKKALKLAHFTRRYPRLVRPMMHWLSRWLVKRLWPLKRRRKVPPFLVEFDRGQIEVDASSFIDHRILFHRSYEPEITRLIRCLVRPGNVCIDVGANIGSHTLVMAFAAGPTGRVIAVEPHPAIAEKLLENIALNHLANVAVVNAALSDSDGTATLYTFEDGSPNQAQSGLRPTQGNGPTIQVRTLTGRTLVEAARIGSCDLIKIDVEGHEMVALRELAPVIEAHHPSLIFEYCREYWDAHGHKFAEAIENLEGWGYRLHVIKESLTVPLEGAVPDSCNLLATPRLKAIELPPPSAP
jgi:FkbM family methyltransferase